MSYLDSKIPPVREHRHPETSLAHGSRWRGGHAAGACPIASRADRSFTQGSICPLLPALGIMLSLPDTVVLMHGSVGCGSCAAGNNVNVRGGLSSRGAPVDDVVWLSTALDEMNVINGGDARLREALVECDRVYRPKVILAVSGCLPGVIGDDIDAAAAAVRDEVKARILPVHCEGFKSRFMATAYDVVYHAVGRHLMPDPASVGPRDPRRVNVMNVGSMGLADERELARLAEALGLEANFFPVFADPDSFARAAEAALSISVCPTHDDYFLTHLEESYGVPHVIRHMPIGIANSGRWLRDLGDAVGRAAEAGKIAEKEEGLLRDALEPFLPAFRGRRAFVSAGEYRSLATASLLQELGFEVCGIRSFHFDSYAEVELEKLSRARECSGQGTAGRRAGGAGRGSAAQGGDGDGFVFNVANVQPFEEANLLRRLKPDVFLGHMHGNSTAARMGIPCQVIYNSGYGYLGYRGAYDLARRLHRKMANPGFYRRLGQFGKLPYRESWYGEDPFSRIRGGEEDGS
ncbi:MAG: nitrogenase component 1 [Deltaproteobacteria bacterium]|jgi:nitrogenase molybdenum-iron protein alpha chain|nr:nitrogenase component 1 [Deltaproteobacteria bacterium]